jgi:hypothetical protein
MNAWKLKVRKHRAGLILLALVLVCATVPAPAHAAVPVLNGRFFNISFSSAHHVDAILTISFQNANGAIGGDLVNVTTGTRSQAFGQITQAPTGGFTIVVDAPNCDPRFHLEGSVREENGHTLFMAGISNTDGYRVRGPYPFCATGQRTLY